ncbi:MAG: OsmC family protein [Bacteroidia bacterium]
MTESTSIETFKVKATGTGVPTRVKVLDTQWAIQVDESEEDGGSNSGPNPMHYFSAGLAACLNEQAQVVAEEMKIELGELVMEQEIDLDLAGFMGMENHSNGSYKQVRLSVKVSGSISESDVQNIGKKVEARCPIMALLKSSGCEIVSHWEKA